MAYRHQDELRADFRRRRSEIERRLAEFRERGKGSDEVWFVELAFCLFAVQTSARRADAAVRHLTVTGLLWTGTPRKIGTALRPLVRFHNHKAAYMVAARRRFLGGGDSMPRIPAVFATSSEAREWLVREVDGFGYKEASHFLRNVGHGEELAILDRHVLKNLRRHGVLRDVPEALSRKRYLAIEEKVRGFAREVRIPIAAVDLLFWSRETGEIFK